MSQTVSSCFNSGHKIHEEDLIVRPVTPAMCEEWPGLNKHWEEERERLLREREDGGGGRGLEG